MARFESLDSLSHEELLELLKQLKEELEYVQEALEKKNLKGQEETDLLNDREYYNSAIKYIENKLDKEKSK